VRRRTERLKNALRERTVSLRELSWSLRLLTLLGYGSVIAMLGATLFLELFGTHLPSVEVKPDVLDTVISVPVLAMLLASSSFALGWAFVLTGATDCRLRVFLPIIALFAFQWVLFVGRGGVATAFLGLGGLLILAGVTVAYFFAHRLRYWRQLPLVEFGAWLTLMLLVVAELFLANTRKAAALDLEDALSFPQYLSIPFWILLGVEAVDGAATLARNLIVRLRRWLAGGKFRLLVLLVLLAHPIISVVLILNDGGWWVIDFIVALLLPVVALGLALSGHFTVGTASMLLALSLILPVITLGWSQPFREEDLTTVVLSVAGVSANILPAALLFVGLAAWDVLNFGVRYVNTEGRIMPRSGRVLLYFGVVLLVAGFTIFYLNARVVRTGQPPEDLELLIDMPFMFGILVLGLPYLAWMVWRRRGHLIGEQVATPGHGDNPTR
jgi:hypothetical protein